jgi:hypothetical protein
MAFISNSQVTGFTGAYGEFFDFFKKPVIVWKKPKKTVGNINTSFLYGYGAPSNETNYTYTARSGIFSGIVVYGSNTPNQRIGEIHIEMPDNQVKLKVELDVRNYINDGKTEKIDIEDRSFFIKSDDIVERYLTKNYYVYTLEEAQ